MNFDNVIKLNERRLRLMPLPPRCASQPQASPYNLTMTPSYWNQATAELANHDHVMAELAERYAGLSLVSRGDAFGTLARSIVGQQISVKAADAVWGHRSGR